MENQIQNNQNSPEFPALSQAIRSNMKSAATWMNFISIVGFILCGFLAIMTFIFLIIGLTSGNLIGFIVFILYAGLIALILIPNFYLFRSASDIKDAVETNDSESLEEAFLLQKKYWRFMGILVIVYLSLIIIALCLNVTTLFFHMR